MQLVDLDGKRSAPQEAKLWEENYFNPLSDPKEMQINNITVDSVVKSDDEITLEEFDASILNEIGASKQFDKKEEQRNASFRSSSSVRPIEGFRTRDKAY